MSEQVTDETEILGHHKPSCRLMGCDGDCGVHHVHELDEEYRQRLLDYDKVVAEMNALREALRIKGDSVRTVQDNYAKLRLDLDTLSRKYREAMELLKMAEETIKQVPLSGAKAWVERLEVLKKDV